MKKESQRNWEELLSRLKLGDSVAGIIVRVEPYGLFLDIEEEFHGFVLAPYISAQKGLTMEEYPRVGEKVKDKIIAFSENEEYRDRFVSVSLQGISNGD